MTKNMLEQWKKEVIDRVEQIRPQWTEVAAYLFSHPELAFAEMKSSAFLVERLKAQGFATTLGIHELATAFVAEIEVGSDGPVIGILAEYDALPDLGHACGHNLIAASAYGAAVALAEVLREKEISAKIKVIGTPAEEDGGGKVILIRDGVFQDLDICMMMHPTSGVTRIAGECLSSHEMTLSWQGKTAHAESHPEDGVNALDALHVYYTAAACLRQQLPADVRLAHVVLNGGRTVGLIPDHCTISVNIVSEDQHLEDVKQKVRRCAEGAALATGCEVDIQEAVGYLGRKNNHTLEALFRKNFALIDEPVMDGMPEDFGTTDFGNVTRVVPSCNPYVSIFTERKISNHTMFFKEQVASSRGTEAIGIGAKVMAASALELILQPEMIREAKAELERSRGTWG